MEKKVFIGLSIIIVSGLALWYLLIYQEQEKNVEQVVIHSEQNLEKLKSAQQAQINIRKIEEKFKAEQSNLNRERTRFIYKDELPKVTTELNDFANEYNLKLMDFTSSFEIYFQDPGEKKIISLPIIVTVHGRYIDIGKFIENWHNLSFYLIADQISIERIEENSNLLEAKITAKLYTRSN